MKNQQKLSLPSLPRRRRLRDFLTGARHEAVKTPRPAAGERRSGEGALSDGETVKTPLVQPGETPGGTAAAGSLGGLRQTPAPLNRVPVNRRAGVPVRAELTRTAPPFDGQRGQPHGVPPEADRRRWKPGTAGFNGEGDDPDFDKVATVPMMVLRSISIQQGSRELDMKSEISQAAGSAAFVSVGNIGGTFLKFGGNVVIQRGLGASAFGLYSLAMAIISLASAIFNLGLDDAMVRYVSIYRAKRQIGLLRGLILFCTGAAGVTGMLGTLLILFYAPVIASVKHSPEMAPLLQALAPLIPLTCLQTIWISGLQGFKEFRWRVLVQRVLVPATLIILLLAGVMIAPNLATLVIVILVNAAIGVVLSLFFFLRKVSGIMASEPGSYDLREWFGFAVPNLFTSIVDTVLESVDTILLAYFAISNVELARYAAAIKLSGFIIMPQASFNAMFAPTIAELHSLGERQKLEAMFKVVTKWVVTFSLPIFFIVVLFSHSLLGISGDAFVAAWPLVIAFGLGQIVNVSTGSVGYILLMTGHQRLSFLNSLTAVVVNVVLGCILAPRYGAMGVAIATGLAVGVVNIMRLLQVRILVKMHPYSWSVLKPLGAALMSAALTGILLYLLSLARLSIQISRFHLSLELGLVPVFLAVYFGLLYLFKVGPEDRIVLDALRRKIRRGKKGKMRR